MSTPNTLQEFLQTPDWEPLPLPLAELRRAKGEHFPMASINFDLHFRADSEVKEGTTISVVGNDLPNITMDNSLWLYHSRQWLQRGASLLYYAANPTPAAVEKLRALKAEFPNQFDLRKPSDAADNSPEAMKLRQMWETFHFAVFTNKPQLWVETYHSVNETMAKNCFYFNPDKAKELPLYESCKRRFDFMFEKYGRDALA